MPNGIPIVVGIGKRGIEIVRLVKGLAYPFDKTAQLGWLGVWAQTTREGKPPPFFPLGEQEVVRIRPRYTEISADKYSLLWWEEMSWAPEAARLRGRLAWFWDQEIDGVRLVTQRLLQIFHAVTENDLSKRLRLFLIVDISEPLFPFALDLAAWLRSSGKTESSLPQNIEIALVLIGRQNVSLQERKWGAASLRELGRILAHPYQGWVVSAQGRRMWLTKRLFDYVFLAETQPPQSKGFVPQSLSGSVAAFLRWLAIPGVGAKVFEHLTNQLVGKGYQKAVRFAIWFTGGAWKLYRPWCVYRALQSIVCRPLESKPTLTLEDFFSGVTGEVYTLFLHLNRKGQGKSLSPQWSEDFIRHALHYAERHLQALSLGAQICWLTNYIQFLDSILQTAGDLGKGMTRSRNREARTQGKFLIKGVRQGQDWLERVRHDVLSWKQAFGVPCSGKKENPNNAPNDTHNSGEICPHLNQESTEWQAWVTSQRNNKIYEFWEGEREISCNDIGAAHRFAQMARRELQIQWKQEGVVLRIGKKELYTPPQRQIVIKALENFARQVAKGVRETSPWAAEMASEVDWLKFDNAPEQWFSAQCKGGCGNNKARLRIWGAPKYSMTPPAGMCVKVPLDEKEALFGLLQIESIPLQGWEIWKLYLDEKRAYEPDRVLHPFLPEYFATRVESRLRGESPCWKGGMKAFTPSFVRFWACPLAVDLLSYAWLYGWVHQVSEVPPRWELRLPGEPTPPMKLYRPSGYEMVEPEMYWLMWLEQVVERCVHSRLPLNDGVLKRAIHRAREEQINAERWEERKKILEKWRTLGDEALCSWAWYLENLLAEEVEHSSH